MPSPPLPKPTVQLPDRLAGQADLSALRPCGYVMRLGISDRAVVNSAAAGRTVYIERGICLD